jgi:ethanolamine utilization cobalamin adenosyltransferase
VGLLRQQNYSYKENDMRKIIITTALIAFFGLSDAQDLNNIKFIDARKPIKCADTKQLLLGIEKMYGEKAHRVGENDLAIDGKPTFVTVLENAKTRSWTIVEYDGAWACVLASGVYPEVF